MFTVPATILGIIQVLAHLFLPLPCEPGSLDGCVWKTETERLNNLPGSHSYKWQSGFELSRSGFRARLLPNMLNAALLWVPWICLCSRSTGEKVGPLLRGGVRTLAPNPTEQKLFQNDRGGCASWFSSCPGGEDLFSSSELAPPLSWVLHLI